MNQMPSKPTDTGDTNLILRCLVDSLLAEAVTGYWVHFARTGHPNSNGFPEWPAYEATTALHLELGHVIRVGSGLRKEMCEALDRIVEKIAREFDTR